MTGKAKSRHQISELKPVSLFRPPSPATLVFLASRDAGFGSSFPSLQSTTSVFCLPYPSRAHIYHGADSASHSRILIIIVTEFSREGKSGLMSSGASASSHWQRDDLTRSIFDKLYT